MATSHNPGQGERLLNIGRRTQSALLDARRQQEADIRDAVYIQPLGNGRHLVKNFCNEQSYKVGSALGSLTFTPGQSVLLASHTGHPGEVIVGLPPIGKRGASLSPIIRHSRSRGTVPVEDAEPEVVACETITGKTYTAIAVTNGSQPFDLAAHVYLDGDWQSTIHTITAQTLSQTLGFFKQFAVQDGAGFVGDNSFGWCSMSTEATNKKVFVWDLGGNTLNTYTVTAGRKLLGAEYVEGYLWVIEQQTGSPWNTYLLKMRADMSSQETVSSLAAASISSSAVIATDSAIHVYDIGSASPVTLFSFPWNGAAPSLSTPFPYIGTVTTQAQGRRMSGGFALRWVLDMTGGSLRDGSVVKCANETGTETFFGNSSCGSYRGNGSGPPVGLASPDGEQLAIYGVNPSAVSPYNYLLRVKADLNYTACPCPSGLFVVNPKDGKYPFAMVPRD